MTAALPFTATCCGATFDADAMAAHLKAAHPRGILSPTALKALNGAEYPLGVSHTAASLRGDTLRMPKRDRGVTLTDLEKEWLGASVRLKDRPGAVWQVWSLAPPRPAVPRGPAVRHAHIVREGVADTQPLANLERVQ